MYFMLRRMYLYHIDYSVQRNPNQSTVYGVEIIFSQQFKARIQLVSRYYGENFSFEKILLSFDK